MTTQTCEISPQKTSLLERVDLANRTLALAKGLAPVPPITLTEGLGGGYTLDLPVDVFGEDFCTYGMSPQMTLALESFIEGLILGAAAAKGNTKTIEELAAILNKEASPES